jgi:hypothetical protein
VRDFSRRSRTRLQQTLCAIPKAEVIRGMLFVTLTYPGSWSHDARVWKRDLDKFGKRFARKYPRAACVWKLEPQPKRKAPHYHGIITGVRFVDRKWLSRAWYEVVGSHDERHLRAGTQVQLVQSHRGVISYAAKYTAKHQELPTDWQEPGRWWGVIGRDNLGIEWVWAPLTERQYYGAARIVRRVIQARRAGQSRAPPRPAPAGCWAVLPDWQALRIALCVLRTQGIGPPERDRERTYARTEYVDYRYQRPLGGRAVQVSAGAARPGTWPVAPAARR